MGNTIKKYQLIDALPLVYTLQTRQRLIVDWMALSKSFK
jgi:hypothetical protein